MLAILILPERKTTNASYFKLWKDIFLWDCPNDFYAPESSIIKNTYLPLQLIYSYNTYCHTPPMSWDLCYLLCWIGASSDYADLETVWMSRPKHKWQSRWVPQDFCIVVISETVHIKNKEDKTASFVLSKNKCKNSSHHSLEMCEGKSESHIPSPPSCWFFLC
jgi:hypothetical protein